MADPADFDVSRTARSLNVRFDYTELLRDIIDARNHRQEVCLLELLLDELPAAFLKGVDPFHHSQIGAIDGEKADELPGGI